MKYIKLIRGDAEIWYPMYEIKPEYIGNGFGWTSFTTDGGNIAGAVSGGNIPGTIQEQMTNIFYDEIPLKASDFGSILQTEDLFETDPDRGGNWLKRAGGDYTEIPIGEKPDDWDANYFDYCTITQDSYWQMWMYSVPIGGSQIDVPPTWSSTEQYYKNNTTDLRQRFTHIFKTSAGFTFGIWTGTGSGFDGYNKHYSRLGTNPGGLLFNTADKFYWRDSSGNILTFSGLNNDQVTWYSALTIMDLSPYGESGYSTISLTDNSRTYYIFVYVTYQNTAYYGIMNLGLSSGGAPVNARMILFDENLWGADSISDEPPEPEPQGGEWGDETARRGGDGTFSAPSDNYGDRAGTVLISAISTANTTFKTVLGGNYNLYYVPPADLTKILAVLYSSDYFQRFENSMYNPLSAVLNCALIPEIFCVYSANTVDMTAGGYNISQHIFPNPVQFANPEPLICKHIGDIDIINYFGGFPDFAPHTQCKLHLPYIGEIAIDTNKIAHGTLSVDYVCDVMSGNVTAWIWCDDKDGNHTYCYNATGNCAYSIPLFASSSDGSAIGKIIGGVASISAGNVFSGIGSIAGGVASVVSHNTEINGTFSGNVGLTTNPKCFLEISRPQWVNPENYQSQSGIPSQISGKISDFRGGFFQVETVDLENVPATDSEIAELEQMLKDGIYYMNE